MLPLYAYEVIFLSCDPVKCVSQPESHVVCLSSLSTGIISVNWIKALSYSQSNFWKFMRNTVWSYVRVLSWTNKSICLEMCNVKMSKWLKPITDMRPANQVTFIFVGTISQPSFGGTLLRYVAGTKLCQHEVVERREVTCLQVILSNGCMGWL